MRKRHADSSANDTLIPGASVPPVSQTPIPVPPDSIPVVQLPSLLTSYLLDGSYQLKSARYLGDQKKLVERRLIPYLASVNAVHVGKSELRGFLIYTRAGGNHGGTTGCSEATVANYFRSLRAFWSWMVAEGVLTRSPFEGMPPPKVPKKPIQPFTGDQLRKLLEAASQTSSPRRDVALVLMLLDTGMRVGELVSLTVGDIDMTRRCASVTGKGSKVREVYWSPPTGRALLAYLRERAADGEGIEEEALFASVRGKGAECALTDNGVRQLMQRLESAAGITGVRCSPHTIRHTFALEFLKSGGNQFDLIRLLGHEDIATTKRYVNQAQGDVQSAHTRFSPVMSTVGKK